MKAVEITSFGPPDVLRLGERPAPVAGAGELLIRVSASGVNRPDVLQRTGNYPVPPGASDIPGLEVAGVVVDGDAAAMAQAGLKPGDRVCALVAGGGYAELCVAPRSAQDYIELSREYHTVLLARIPAMSDLINDAARRFINLVDEFYDRGVKLIVSAEAPIESLYTGSRLKFEFERTKSRLQEMQSKEYLCREHLP